MSLPITRRQARTAARWMKRHYGDRIARAVRGTPFSVNLLCGIACQETAIFWLNFIDDLSPDEVLARCVLDASGDYPGTVRMAFPRNTEAFVARYGQDLADMLIEEANISRVLRGFRPQRWVYKGYGLFQYDLQHIVRDKRFFTDKRWYLFDQCLDRAMRELRTKYARTGNLWSAVRAYNGTGPAATRYANNVMQFTAYCAEVDG